MNKVQKYLSGFNLYKKPIQGESCEWRKLELELSGLIGKQSGYCYQFTSGLESSESNVAYQAGYAYACGYHD